MKNVLILHGTDGHSQENWFPWIKRELERESYKVWVPNLPRSEKPNILRYNDFIFPKWKFDSNSIIVGHSSGAVAALGLLQELPDNIVINKAFLVAGFIGNLDWDALDELAQFTLDWQKIKTKAKKFVLIHSDDDPYVPLEHGKKLKKYLNGELIIVPGQKHFSVNTDSKYTQFPELLEKILE